MQQEQVTNVLRTILAASGAYVAGRWPDIVSTEQWAALIGFVPALVAFYFDWKKGSTQGRLASAANLPEVKAVVVQEKQTADAVPNDKVVAPDNPSEPVVVS